MILVVLLFSYSYVYFPSFYPCTFLPACGSSLLISSLFSQCSKHQSLSNRKQNAYQKQMKQQNLILEKHPFLFYRKGLLLLNGNGLFYYLVEYIFVTIKQPYHYREIILILLQFEPGSTVSGYYFLPISPPNFCFRAQMRSLSILQFSLSRRLFLRGFLEGCEHCRSIVAFLQQYREIV